MRNKSSARPILIQCLFFCVLLLVLCARVITVYHLRGLSLALVLALTLLLIVLFLVSAVKRYKRHRKS